jgi:hypothetical protein
LTDRFGRREYNYQKNGIGALSYSEVVQEMMVVTVMKEAVVVRR